MSQGATKRAPRTCTPRPFMWFAESPEGASSLVLGANTGAATANADDHVCAIRVSYRGFCTVERF